MSAYFGDPDDALKQYEKDEAAYLSRLPVCSYCGEPIQDERMYAVPVMPDATLFFCEKCMDDFQVWTEYYTKEN